MNKANLLERIFISLGTKNNAALFSASIAGAKGIFRPIFTMSDKNSDPTTKKYTAIRESLTELIAIPIYLASGKLATFISDKLKNPKWHISSAKKRLGENATKEEILKLATELATSKHDKIHANLAFAGVALAALLVIPALCSATIKPIMNVMQKHKKNKPQQQIDTVNNMTTYKYPMYTNQYKTLNTFYNTTNIGMKVGGV